MNQGSWEKGKDILGEYNLLNTLLQKTVYTEADKQAILASIDRLGLGKSDESEFIILRQNRGHLLQRPRSGPAKVIADGRGDWIGWLELKKEAVNEVATQMTAKVIKDINADILAVIEAEDRISLKRFNDQLLKPIDARYSSIMLIDGNDDRGIDVGLMVKSGCTVESLVSHMDDTKDDPEVFSRDCPEFSINTGGVANIVILVNHLKSKGYGLKAESDARRKRQASRVREIYDQRRSQGVEFIAIVGDLNDTPDSDPLSPLLSNGSDLKEISDHPNFQGDGRKGTYKNGAPSQKIDYLLLSPLLYSRVKGGGVFRKGVWGGTNGTLFPHYEEMKREADAASDHAAVWADIDL
jgi:endonuclease/exonuclease/phosphatase family metal-dependent hydrolase